MDTYSQTTSKDNNLFSNFAFNTAGTVNPYHPYAFEIIKERKEVEQYLILNYLEKECDSFRINKISDMNLISDQIGIVFEMIENFKATYIIPEVRESLDITWIRELFDIEEQINFMEQKSGLKSEEFFEKWINDEMPDTFENNAWSILIEAKKSIIG